MGRRAISEFQVKQTAYPNAGRSWYIIGRPGGKRIRAWFDTQLVAEAEATQRNLSIQRFGQQAASFSGSLAYMAMECQSRLQPYGKSLHDATAHYLRHLESVNRSIPLSRFWVRFVDLEIARSDVLLAYNLLPTKNWTETEAECATIRSALLATASLMSHETEAHQN